MKKRQTKKLRQKINKMAAQHRPENVSCTVDIRLFLLTIIVSMLGAFFAGVCFVPPQALLDSLFSMMTSNQIAQSSELSNAAVYTSLDYSPSGQHLLVDIEGVESAFLDSEERLSDAMVQTVQEAGLTMLSYHCHKLDPAGISCVGVLLESHISFHTWPEEGVITLDLFTCGANPLLPVVPVIERLFGVGTDAKAKWSHELRGFRSMEEKKKNYLDNFSDLSLMILSPLEIRSKKMIYSNLTKYQRIDIWELAENGKFPTFVDGHQNNFQDGDPRWLDSAYSTPDRVLFLDGVLQNMYSHEVEYHEALVHPPMFSHPNPERIGIIGGGEGAILREVLKHNTVKQVTMIEVDNELIRVMREHLPRMSDCSYLPGRADNCFDDKIVDIVHEDGLKWFLERFGEGIEVSPNSQFDVILIDALDPELEVPFSTDLYVDADFVNAIMQSLSSDGVLMIQIGSTPDIADPKPEAGMSQMREKLFSVFEEHHLVAAMHVYDEPHSGFPEPQSSLIVCRDTSCRNRWYARSDFIDYEIHDRILRTKTGQPSLRFYDGTIQHAYQMPAKAWETVYCRREPAPFECAYRSLDFTKEIHEFSLEDDDTGSFTIELQKNAVGEVTGSTVIAKVDIPEGSYIMPDHLARSMVLNEENIESIQSSVKMGSPAYAHFMNFISLHAHKSYLSGMNYHFLEVGATILIRDTDTVEEANIAPWVPRHPSGKQPPFSPVYDRHQMSFGLFLIAIKDIKSGTELKRSAKMWSVYTE